MEKFRRFEAIAAPMPRNNIDTDAIIPVKYMKDIHGDFGKCLFADLRIRPDGSENPDFVLNRPEYRAAGIIVAGNNFACGSSREHAVWALLGYGIKCVIAESFGDIFYNNSFRMGLLPITLRAEDLRMLSQSVVAAAGQRNTIVDLEAQLVTGPDGRTYPFEVDSLRRRMLLEGLDGVGVTLLRAGDIAAFQKADKARRPWVYDFGLSDGTPR